LKNKEVIEHKMCVLISLQLQSEKNSHYKKQSARFYRKCT